PHQLLTAPVVKRHAASCQVSDPKPVSGSRPAARTRETHRTGSAAAANGLGHHEDVDASSVAFLREALAGTEWVERTRELGLALRATRSPGGLLLLGTPAEEPWHLTAHLADEARLAGLPQLAPTLVRWSVPVGAPAHLS